MRSRVDAGRQRLRRLGREGATLEVAFLGELRLAAFPMMTDAREERLRIIGPERLDVARPTSDPNQHGYLRPAPIRFCRRLRSQRKRSVPVRPVFVGRQRSKRACTARLSAPAATLASLSHALR